MLKKNSSVEDQANAVEQQRNRGSKVVYGQPIQLRHQFTGKYIHFSKKEMAELATKTMRVELQAYNAKQAQFRIMPRYKVRSEGDVVCIGDQVVLESIKSHGQYISVSEDVFPEDSVYAFRHEINFSVVHSTFTVYRQACAYDAQKEYLTPNGCVRFFHKEIDAYICAEGQFNDSVMQDVHLRVRGIDYSIPKTVFPSTSAITYWQIEAKNSMFPGGFLQWETPVRFQHMITQLYLTVKKDGKYTLTLTDDRNDTGTVFKLYPVVKKNEPIPKGSYCRIKHVITGYWMQALQEEVPRETLVQGTSTAFSDIEWTTAVMKKVGLSEQMMFADAFTIQNVEPENLTNFSFMCGYIPLLQNLIQYGHKRILVAKEVHDIVKALKELEAWMFIDGRPIKKRQKLVRNLLGIRSMVTLLQAKWECVPYRSTMIMVQIYCVLNAYLKGDSRKNELWLARHNVFFLHQISLKGPVGQRATIMLTELLDGNRKVIDRMSEKQVDYIIELLAENMDYRYLDLLGVLCVCQDVAIRRHQKYIAEAWLKSTKKPIYDTKVGQAIGEDSNVIYVSTNRKTWTSLNEFTNKVGGTSEEQLKFLHSQLNLMSKICQNRNEMAIQILTAELKYLTWDEAMLCLTNPELPDDLRAQYCKLIIVLFVDVPGNISTAEDVLMTMEYDNIVTNNMRSDSEKILDKVVDSGELNTHLEQLKRWIMEFLSENRFMVMSDIGRSRLIEQVLRLVYLLVTYCCYDTKVALREVLEPLLGILDGRNDQPFPPGRGTSATEEEMELFHSSGRYQMSLENNAVIDAKYQAIDLVLNIRFNNRLEAFAGLFKEVHSMKDHDHPLSPIISGNFEESSISRYRDDVMDRLGEIVDNTAILQPGVLVDILSDISAYKYDNLVMKATHLLVRYYSAFENLLSRAITAKILVNDESLKNLKKVRNRIPLLSLVVNSAINPDNAQKICPLLDELIRMCVIEGDVTEPHPMNQSIIWNQGISSKLLSLLSQDISVRREQQYAAAKRVKTRCLQLLKLLAQGNVYIQQQLFSKIDFLLKIKGVSFSEIGYTIAQIFINNKDNCLRIQASLMQRMVKLAVEHNRTAPGFIFMLKAVAKVDDLDLPLNRNQDCIIKCLSEDWQGICCGLDVSREFREKILQKNELSSVDLRYYTAVYDLMATCAEGENSFIDSLCQALMDEFEALEYLIGDNIGLYTKRAILRFYRWVYVNTGANVEDPTSSLRDEKIFVLLEQINNILQQCDKFSESRPETARHLLRLTAAEKPERNDLAWYHSALVFLLDAALPFVEAFLTSCYPRLKVTNERHRVIIARLAESVVMFGRAMDPMISAWAHRKTYARTLRAVFQRTDYKEPQDWDLIEANFCVKRGLITTPLRLKYLNQYDDEGDINEDFNMFAANVKKIFGGENTVEAQIGYPLKRPYTRFDSDEELPLSPEFQILVQCFIDQRPSLLLHQKYGRAMHLINYFRFSCKITKDKKLREGKENVDMKAMMVLTGLIYNEIIKLPEDWEKKQQKNKVIRKLLKSIKELQNLINSFNAIPSIMLHLSHNSSDDAVRQVLAFLSVMLFNGNPNVQKSLFDYFKSTREERFFITLKAKTQQAAMEIKGIRMVHQKYKSAILDTVESVKMLAHKAGAVPRLLMEDAKQSLVTMFHSVSTLKDKRQSYNRNVTVHVKKMIEVVAKETSKDKIEDCMNTFIREQPDASKVGNLGLILKIMGLMCDGQNRNLQDYFREQSDNFLSCNMVAETSLLLDVLLADVSDFTIVLLGSVLQTLVEFASGNQRNQQVLFDSKVIDFVDYVLQEKRLNECSDMLMLWVKKCIGNLIRVLTEENPSDDGDDSSKVILESLDADSVGKMVSGCFYQSRLYKYTDRQASAWYLEVGFHYFLILCRMIELCHDGNAIKRDFLNTKGNEEVWKYFSNNTMSIEIVKNDKLHRINFPVTCRGALRKKVKESFNYEVDRNPSERIKNFMEWVNEIKDDIAYTRMIYNNIISRTLINRWQYLNTTMIFLSFLQCVLFTACWDADEDDSVFKPIWRYDWSHRLFVILSVCHIIASLLVMIAYFLIHRPALPKFTYLRNWFTKRRIRFRPIDQVPEQRKEHTFIRSHFISVACLWYLSLPFVSVLAMTHDGFFFSYHLLHSAASNQIINRAIRSVTKNGISLLLTLFYALILIYIFTQVHFVFYREMFTDSFCNTMYECFVSVLHVGLIVGPTEGFASPENKPFTYLLGKAAVDLSFFIIISTILLNIVFGIIVDTFAELRDSKWQADQEMKSMCFICGRESHDFERKPGGFERHVKQEHNQWAYVFFMLHLDETSTNDYTALELYVSRKLAKEEYDFFPKDRALCLEYIEDQEERKLAILEKKMSYMVQRIKQLEAEVEFEKERSRQEQWEKENKTSKKLLSKQPSVFALIAEAPPSAVIDQPSSSLGDQRYMEALERPQTSILDSRRQANDEVITLEDAESTEEKPK